MELSWTHLVEFATLAISVSALVYAWISSRQKDIKARFDRLQTQTNENEAEIKGLKHRVDELPSAHTMHRLELKLTELAGEMGAMKETVKGTNDILRRIENTVTRHEDHLLEGNKK